MDCGVVNIAEVFCVLISTQVIRAGKKGRSADGPPALAAKVHVGKLDKLAMEIANSNQIAS